MMRIENTFDEKYRYRAADRRYAKKQNLTSTNNENNLWLAAVRNQCFVKAHNHISTKASAALTKLRVFIL